MTELVKISTLEDGFKCFWIVEDFIRCRNNNGLELKSSNFKIHMLQDSKWYLEIRVSVGSFEICLFKSEGLSFRSNVHLSIYSVKSYGWAVQLNDCIKKFTSGGVGYGLSRLYWDELSNGTLTVCFHLWNGATRGQTAQCVMASKMINEREILHLPFQKFTSLKPSDLIRSPLTNNVDAQPKQAPTVETSTKSIQTDALGDSNDFDDLEDLLRLYKEKKFRYVILRTHDPASKTRHKFAAHKSLLCARSPVFNAMFNRDMRENDSNVVDIEDIDGDTLSLFCNFLHLEPLEDLKWDSAVKLFYAADKYQVDQLKNKCTLSMKNELTEDNVCEAFVLADMYQEKELMQSALEFFCKNSKRIIGLPEWKNLTLTRAELASDILCKMAERFANLCS